MSRVEFSPGTEQASALALYKAALFDSGAVLIAPSKDKMFTLRNGTKSWVYIDHGQMLCLPEHYKPFFNAMLEGLKQDFSDRHVTLANVDSKSSPATTGVLSFLSWNNQMIVYPEEVRRGTNKWKLKIDMPHIAKESTIVLVDDVLTPGDVTAIHVYQHIKRKIWRILRRDTKNIDFHLLVGLIRDPKAAERLEKYGLHVHWLLTLEEVLKEAPNHMNITQEQRKGIEETLGIII